MKNIIFAIKNIFITMHMKLKASAFYILCVECHVGI